MSGCSSPKGFCEAVGRGALEAEMAALLRKAELIDAQEDERYGKDKRGDELPPELQCRQERIEVLRKARAELEAEAAADHAR